MVVELTPDCQRCAALCCVALAFDKGRMFAFDKPAGAACRHLVGHGCAIHPVLEEAGFAGCARYDCEGAGQRVVQALFAGQSWRDTPALLRPMLDAFAHMRQLHGLLALLETAKGLDLPKDKRAELAALHSRLSAAGHSRETLATFAASGLPQKVQAFLRSLKEVL